jgi:hypothetical protein
MTWATTAAIALSLAIVIYGGHRLLTWAERRGWVYYRSTDRPRPRPIGILEEIYDPSMAHVIDQRVTDETEADQAESGEEFPNAGQ